MCHPKNLKAKPLWFYVSYTVQGVGSAILASDIKNHQGARRNLNLGKRSGVFELEIKWPQPSSCHFQFPGASFHSLNRV